MAKDRKEKRRRRRGGLIDLVNAILTLVVIALLAGVGIFLFGANQFYAPGAVKADTAFMVERGSRLSTIAERLEEQGLVGNKYVFQIGTWALKKQTDIKAGVYTLKADYSMSDILREITEGQPVDFFVNVIPGETAWQVAQRLNDPNLSLTGESVPVPPEGSLLAVRHDFFPGDTRQSVLQAMQEQMQAQVAAIWADRDPAIDEVIKSPEDMVTLASIVEKETGLASERPAVAAVFINRLKKKMRLQTDPTVLYGVTMGQQVLNRSPTSSELKANNPYNTYQIPGLPPGPIANPGVEALRAVAHPAPTKDLYFVAKSANPADGHLFAPTYEQHRKNVTLYRAAAASAAAEREAEAEREALEAEAAKAGGETVPATP